MTVAPLRVCMLVTYDLASAGGGVKQHALHLADSLRRRGDHVTIVGPSSKPIDLVDHMAFGGIVNVPSNGSDNMLGLLSSPRAIARFFRQHAFDVIHVHEPLNPALAYWAVWMTSHVPHVATFHAYAEQESRTLRFWRRTAAATQFPWYQRAIAVSAPAARHAAVAWRRPMAVIPNGVPSSIFTPSEAEPTRAADAPVRLLFVGRLGDRRKGASCLYDAYRGLLARQLAVTLDIVGERGDAPLPPELPGLHYHGAVDLDRLSEIYRRCDVFVAPSTGQESFGIVLLEAMASAKPIVCSDIEGYRQVVVPEGATLVPPSDPRALEDALANIVELGAVERARKGAINRRAAEVYDWERVTDRVRAEYVEAIATHTAERTRNASAVATLRASPSRWLPVSGMQAFALLALCVVLRAVSLVHPCLSDDEATYAVVAREMLAGKALYRDVVDHKPPAIYLVNSATQAVAGPVGGMVLLHALLIIVVWMTGLLLAAIVRRHGNAMPCGPPLAALLWTVFTTTLFDTDSIAANCELFMVLPIVASVLVFLRAISGARRPVLAMAAAGVLVGVAMLFKYQAGVQLPLYGIAWCVVQRRTPWRVLAGIVALAVGVALPIAAAAGWLAAAHALPAAWFWFRFNFAYISAGSTSDTFSRMLVRGGFVVVAAAPLYAFAAAAIARRGTSRDDAACRRLGFGWLTVSAAAVLVGGRFFGHYFHQVTAPLVVLAAPAAARMWDGRRKMFVALLAVPAITFLVLTTMHDRFMSAVGQPDPDYGSVVAWLDEHAPRSESICIWGNSPVLYFEADRPLGCRFVFANYLTGMSPATATQTDVTVDASMNIVPEAWDMLEADLAVRRPLFIIDGSAGDIAFYGKWPPELFPRLARILARGYVAEAQVAGMRIFRRRSPSP